MRLIEDRQEADEMKGQRRHSFFIPVSITFETFIKQAESLVKGVSISTRHDTSDQ